MKEKQRRITSRFRKEISVDLSSRHPSDKTMMKTRRSEKLKYLSPDNRPHFFKIMMPGLTDHQLRIPPDFTKGFLKGRSGKGILEGPTGDHWHVKLLKTEDGTFLKDGWRDFLEDHSLWGNEFLVFRYDGDLCFNVKVFDATACERKYLPKARTEEESYGPRRKKRVTSPEEPTEASCKTKGVPPKPKPKRKKRVTPPEEPTEASCKTKGEPPEPKNYLPCSCIKRGRPPKSFMASTSICQSEYCTKKSGHLSRRPPTEQEIDKAWTTAKSLTSERPYFIRRLSKSAVSVSYVLRLPTDFAKKYLPNCKTKIDLLDGQKTWSVIFIPGKTMAFCGGWTGVVRDNRLEEDDFCVFELVCEFQFAITIVRPVPLSRDI